MSKPEILPPPSSLNDSERFLYCEQGGSFGRLPQFNGVDFHSVSAGNVPPAVVPTIIITPYDITRKAFRLGYIRDQIASSIRARSANKHFTADDYEQEHVDRSGVSLSQTKYHDVNGVISAAETSDWNALNMADIVSMGKCAFMQTGCPFFQAGDCSKGLLAFLRSINPAERRNFGKVMDHVRNLDGTHDIRCDEATQGIKRLQSKGILPR